MGLIIAGLNLFNIQREADAAAPMYGLKGSHPVEYEGSTWYRPGAENEFESRFFPPIRSFREFYEADLLNPIQET